MSQPLCYSAYYWGRRTNVVRTVDLVSVISTLKAILTRNPFLTYVQLFRYRLLQLSSLSSPCAYSHT